MVRVICLFSNEKGTLTALQLLLIQSVLILQSSNNDPSTRSKHRANIQNKQKVQLRTIHQNKIKALKERTKG